MIFAIAVGTHKAGRSAAFIRNIPNPIVVLCCLDGESKKRSLGRAKPLCFIGSIEHVFDKGTKKDRKRCCLGVEEAACIGIVRGTRVRIREIFTQ